MIMNVRHAKQHSSFKTKIKWSRGTSSHLKTKYLASPVYIDTFVSEKPPTRTVAFTQNLANPIVKHET